VRCPVSRRWRIFVLVVRVLVFFFFGVLALGTEGTVGFTPTDNAHGLVARGTDTAPREGFVVAGFAERGHDVHLAR
jgi:hypothetical protein